MVGSKEVDVHLLARIAATEKLIRSNIDLIPINNWGFSESVKEQLKMKKHQTVNQHLSEGEKQKLSNASKQRLARGVGGVCRTVSDVLDWMAKTKTFSNTKPKARRIEDEKTENSVTSESASQKEPEKKSGEEGLNGPSVKKHKTEIKNDAGTEMTNEQSDEEMNEDDFVSKADVGGLPSPESKEQRKRPESSTTDDTKKPKGLKKAELKRKRAKGKVTATEDGNEPSVRPSTDKEIEMANFDPLEGRKLAMQRLQAKIAQLKSLRRGKKTAQQCEEVRKLKRRMSKMKMKERRKAGKRKILEDAGEGNADAKRSKKEEPAVKAPVNDAGEVVYSKFDFIIKDDKEKMTKKDKRDKFTGRDYKRLLEKAEKRKEKIEEIRKKNPEKAERIEENIRWQKAINRAEGQKVKDDPELLRKGLKRKEKMKERKKRKWAERVERVKEMQAKQQERRNANIQARKDAVKKKKLQKARKKGRIL